MPEPMRRPRRKAYSARGILYSELCRVCGDRIGGNGAKGQAYNLKSHLKTHPGKMVAERYD